MDELEGITITEKGIEAAKRIDNMYRNTTMTHDEIADMLGFPDGSHVQVLYAVANRLGVLDD